MLDKWIYCKSDRNSKEMHYVALGNSIAYGFGATNYKGYVNHFHEYLTTVHKQVQLTNLAIPGIPSTPLLLQLKLDLSTRGKVKEADVITISIGGNNLLLCARANYEEIIEPCAELGSIIFENDWPLILEEIRKKIKSTAQIYVMTLYNPFEGDDVNYPKADVHIRRINNTIFKYMNKYNYKVADVYTHFTGKINNDWKACTWTHFCEKPRDPHPTDSGHYEIYRLHKNIYSETAGK